MKYPVVSSLIAFAISTSILGTTLAHAAILPECDVTKHGQAQGVGAIALSVVDGKTFASITVKSVATDCRIKVGMASYQKFDEVIKNQIIYNIDFGGFLEPGEQRLLKVEVPPCAAQLDVYQGDAITDYFSGYYCPGWPSNCRLITALHNNCSNPTAGGTCTGGSNGTPNSAVPYCTRMPPVCSAGAVYSTGLECSTTAKSIVLDASQSDGLGLTYKWSTTCPQSAFSPSDSDVKPTFTLPTLAAVGSSVKCQVNLVVTDRYGVSSNCSSAVLGGTCNGDCAGTVNGSAKADVCGVCNGDGSTCKPCDPTNIQDKQLGIDSNLAALKGAVSQLVKLTEKALVKAQLTGRQANAVRAANQSYLNSASSVYTAGWQATYTTIPGTILNCGVNTACVTVSTAAAKANLAQHSDSLLTVAKNAHKMLKSVTKKLTSKNSSLKKKFEQKATKIVAQANANFSTEQSLIASIPSSTSSCR